MSIGRLAYIIDENGFVLSTDVVYSEEEYFEGNLVAVSLPPDVSFFKRRWDGERWVEGATQEEIDEILKPKPQPPTDAERIDMLENMILLMMEG